MHVLIVGFGETAKLLANNLLAQGHQVTGLSRRGTAYAGVYMLAQDVHCADLAGLPSIDWVYVLLSPDERHIAAYEHTFLQSLQPLYESLQQHPVQRVVFVSSTSVYGQGQGEQVDEFTPPHPAVGSTAAVLWQAEQQWREVWQDRLIVVRPSGIYGAGRLRLIRWVQSAKPVLLNQWTNRIHVQDLAAILAGLASDPAPEKLYVATDMQPAWQHEVLDGIAAGLGLPAVARQPAPVSGKQLSATHLARQGYHYLYPTWKEGYASAIQQLTTDKP